MTQGRKVTVSGSSELAEELGADEIYTIVEELAAEGEEDTITIIPDVDAKEDEFEPSSVEDLPDDEEIWPDGPTAGQIKAWKKEYGEVYVTSISYEKHIAWRPLGRLEYKQLVKKMEQMVQSGQLSSAEANLWNEEAITELCVLFPSSEVGDMVREMAGLPSLISQEVLEASGFVALEVRQL
jgi:hypothetical protein